MSALYGFGGYFLLMYFTSLTTSILMAFVYIFPFIQIFISNERRKWLHKYFEHNPSSGENEDMFRKRLLEAAVPVQPFPLYKMLKFYLISSGIIGIVLGFLIMVLPIDSMNDIGRKLLIFVPMLVGVAIYFLHKKLYPDHGLWREIAGFFLLLGVAVTSFGCYEIYHLDNIIRSDLFLYAVLGFGLFVMHYLNSTIASYLYMILIVFGSSFVGSDVGYNWMMFMTHFIWFFALAVLSFWLPRLREAKQIEFREILFGVLFFGMILSLGMNNTSGLGILAIVVLIPCLYIFSKIHFKHATWFGARPMEVVTILAVIVSSIALSIPDLVAEANQRIELFSNFSFHKLFAFVLILIAALIGYTMYADQSDEDQKRINPLIVFFPIVSFLLVYLLGDYGTQYLVNLFLLILGLDYVRRGLKFKDSIQLILGCIAVIAALAIRLQDMEEYLEEKFFIGLIVMVFGFVFAGLALYMREKWIVSGPDDSLLIDDHDQTVSSNNGAETEQE